MHIDTACLLVGADTGGVFAPVSLAPQWSEARIRSKSQCTASAAVKRTHQPAAGYVKLPECPGLGVELDPMTVERYRVQ